VEKWAEVRVLFHREGLTQREIARRLGISRDTVKNALGSEEPPRVNKKRVTKIGAGQSTKPGTQTPSKN
jgi:transposase